MSNRLILFLRKSLITPMLFIGVGLIGQGKPTIESIQTEPIPTFPEKKSKDQTAKDKNTQEEGFKAPLPAEKKISPATESIYLYPGALIYQNGRWEGGDYLVNLGDQIGVFVNILKPENAKINFNEEDIKKRVIAAFTKANLNPTPPSQANKPPLPDLQIELLIYPITKGLAAYCSGRLFESVTLERFSMPENVFFQAITWEKKNLLVSPTNLFNEQVFKSVDEITQAFIERYQSQKGAAVTEN
jgi:hypothetical protein